MAPFIVLVISVVAFWIAGRAGVLVTTHTPAHNFAMFHALFSRSVAAFRARIFALHSFLCVLGRFGLGQSGPFGKFVR